MNLSNLRVALSIACLSLVAGCAGLSGPKVRTGPFILPGGANDRFVEVTASGFSWNDGELLASAPATAGEPRGAGIDLQQAYAVIAYDNATAIYNLFAGTATWIEFSLDEPYAHVAVLNGFATVVSGTVVHVLDLESETRVEYRDLSRWMGDVGLGRLDAATPIEKGELCLVASKRRGKGVVLQRVQYGLGEWRMSTRSEVEVFTRLDDVAVDGAGLFLTGIREVVQPGAGTRGGRVWSTLVIVRADPTNLTHSEIVFLRLQERTPAVREIAAGNRLVGVLMEGGSLTAFKVNESGTSSSPDYQDYVPGARAIAWTGDDQLVVRFESETKTIDLGGR